MKIRFIILTALVVAFANTAMAQFFPASAYVRVLPGQVTAEVYNPHYEPVICNGQVFGQTYTGRVYNAFFYEQFIPAGQYRFAFVQTFPHDPFATGWSNIYCRFARFF